MLQNNIKSAIVIALNTKSYNQFDMIYGGETLLNRTLIALSKSGIENAKLICNEGNRLTIEKWIYKIHHRIKIQWEIVEKKPEEYLSEKIKQAVHKWKNSFIILESDSIWHPTTIKQTLLYDDQNPPILFCYKNVSVKEDQVKYYNDFKDKHKIIFKHPEELSTIAMSQIDENIFQSGSVKYSCDELLSPQAGLFSMDVITCNKTHFNNITHLNNLQDILQEWVSSNLLQIGFIGDAWWLKITSKVTKEQTKELFWRIAFKEISGEFSKIVNSRLSKPMTFLFVRMGFSPNAISFIEIILFLIAAGFLFIPEYWGMVVFAVIWQFSAGVLDRCDGEVARLRNYESPAGGRFDMLIDDLRFAIPLVILGVVCFFENPINYLYPIALTTILLWYVPAAVYQQIFMYKAGYVSVQAMGVDYFKVHEKEIPKNSWQHKIRPFFKGDIRTFYVFVLSFSGYKPVIFWVLFIYELMVGIGNYITVKGMRKVIVSSKSKNL